MDEKPCPYPYMGCVSEARCRCHHNGPCEPVDEISGRDFAVLTWKEGNTRMTTRVFKKEIAGVIDADQQNAYLAARGRV